MRISVGADERNHTVEWTLNYLKEQGNQVAWYGPQPGEMQPWPEVARGVALDVAGGKSTEGILFAGPGQASAWLPIK